MYIERFTKQTPVLQAAIIFLTLLPLYSISYSYCLHHPYGGSRSPFHDSIYHNPSEFINTWLSTHIVQPFNPFPLSSYCNHTTWHPNLVFRLTDANGGIGNVRGNILDFLFFSIEAGASIMLPDMAARSPQDLSNVWAGRMAFDRFFDEDWFVKTMAEACPQMKIYKPREGEAVVMAVNEGAGNYLPRSRRVDLDPSNTRSGFLADLEAWLTHRGRSLKEFEKEGGNVTVVNVERTLWEVDTRSLPQGLRRNFGHLLRINPTVRRLSAPVVQRLVVDYSILHFDPDAPIPRHAFYGAHLRTESDAKTAGWLAASSAVNFTVQTDAYISHAIAHGLRLLYVASGDAAELATLKRKAAAHSPALNVTSKWDLLPPAERKELERLSWDQQALVDHEVLQRSSVFGGMVKSSFSFQMAVTRAQWLEDRGRVVEDPWGVRDREEGVAFDDGVSRILGRDAWHEMRVPRGMWP